MNNKIEILVEMDNYDKDVKGGAEHFGVMYTASTYGGASPCDTIEAKNKAILHAKGVIREAGDIPIVNDLTEEKKLHDWF